MISYIQGDATSPIGSGIKVIAHVNNDIRRWGKGFVLAISKKWKEPEYHFKNKQDMTLGTVDFVPVESDIIVANMIAQHTIWCDKQGNPPIRYNSLHQALSQVGTFCINNNCTLHMPRIGCGLAGGKWEIVEQIINETICSKNINVYVYDI